MSNSPQSSSAVSDGPYAWRCCDKRYPYLYGIVTVQDGTVEAWREGGVEFQPLYPLGFAQGQQQPAAWVKDLLDLYFAPWGAAKAARFGAMTGDAPFDPEAVLRLIHQKLSPSVSSTLSNSGAE